MVEAIAGKTQASEVEAEPSATSWLDQLHLAQTISNLHWEMPVIPLLPQPAPIDWRNSCCSASLGGPVSAHAPSGMRPSLSSPQAALVMQAYTRNGVFGVMEFRRDCAVCGTRYLTCWSEEPVASNTRADRKQYCKRQYYRNATTQSLFNTGAAFIENALFEEFEAELEYGHLPFQAKVHAHKSIFGEWVNEKTFTQHWFAWTAVRWLSEYKLPMAFEYNKEAASTHKLTSELTGLTRLHELDEELMRVYRLVHPNFVRVWMSEHVCPCGANCKLMCAIDGHFKVHRSVCVNKHKSHIDIGSWEHIPMHCEASPWRDSKYCFECKPGSVGQGSASGLPAVRNIYNLRNRAVGEYVVDSIQEYNEIDNTFRIRWLMYGPDSDTWEPAAHVPIEMQKHFLSDRGYEQTVSEAEASESGCVGADKEASTKKPRSRKKEKKKEASIGCICAAWSCGTVFGVRELYVSESKLQATLFLLEILDLVPETEWPSYLAYDDACHLYKFIKKRADAGQPKLAAIMRKVWHCTNKCCSKFCGCVVCLQITFVIDNFHMRNHVDTWCKANMNAKQHKELDGYNTQVCEQTFSWLRGFKYIARSMSESHFKFFVLRMFELHNRRRAKAKAGEVERAESRGSKRKRNQKPTP